MLKQEYPYQNRSLTNIKGEKWMPIPEMDELFWISSYGRIKSLSRYISRKTGKGFLTKERIVASCVQKTFNQFVGDCMFQLYAGAQVEGNRYRFNIRRLVYHLFVSPLPSDPPRNEVIAMKDDNGLNCEASNLKLISVSERQQRIFRRITLIKSGFLIAGKLVITILSLSVFMLLNAFYSLGMGIAKYMSYGMKSKEKREQIIVFRQIGYVIVVTGFCYVLYSIRLFVTSEGIYFPPIIANIIAIYTFIEFSLNIRNYIKIWNNHDLESEAIRHIRLSATLISFVMTQVAILSFAAEDFPLASSGLSGIIFGGMAALIGVYMIIRSYYLRTKMSKNLV